MTESEDQTSRQPGGASEPAADPAENTEPPSNPEPDQAAVEEAEEKLGQVSGN